MLKLFPLGSDLTLLNTIYHYPKRQDDGKYGTDSITLIYKDNVTGRKFKETIEEPEYTFYISKDGTQVDYNQLFVRKSDVEPVTVKYVDILKEIASRTNNTEFYYENIKAGNRSANKALYTLPEIFNADMNIEDYYRFKFKLMYGANICTISKAYLDIEADTINMRGDFPEMGECPINALTIIDDQNNRVYTLLLRNSNNLLIAELEAKMGEEFIEKIRATLINTVPRKKYYQYGLDKLNFEIEFYDDEIDLIADSFTILNTVKPDFVMAWNMAFDIPYIIERLKVLGVDPKNVMCHEDFKIKECEYFIDERVANLYAERGDFAKISSYSIYLDQMIHFASRRKGQSAIKDFKLSTVGSIFAKAKKLDYSHITHNIADLPYLNYEIFVIYNIVDTIVQKCIEHATDDISFVFAKSHANNTRYEKAHRNTVYLTNRGTEEFYSGNDECLIIGNNVNKFKEKPSEKFPGAIVGDPTHIEPDFLMKLNGQPIRIVDNVTDYDFKSLYPSTTIECNIAHHTQIGRIIIDQQMYANENEFNDEQFNRGGKFIEDLNCKNYIDFCHRWFNFAGYEAIYDDVLEYCKEVGINKVNTVSIINGITYFNAVSFVKDKDMKFTAVGFEKEPIDMVNAVSFYRERPNIKGGVC